MMLPSLLTHHPQRVKENQKTVPSLVLGPFGCGKTRTLFECVKLLMLYTDSTHLLVCTHSNSAADLYVEYLHKQWTSESIHLSHSLSHISLSLLQNKENQKTSLCQINFTPYDGHGHPSFSSLHLSISDCNFALRIRSPQSFVCVNLSILKCCEFCKAIEMPGAKCLAEGARRKPLDFVQLFVFFNLA